MTHPVSCSNLQIWSLALCSSDHVGGGGKSTGQI